MSSFFTVPSSQRKRKRIETTDLDSSKRRNIATASRRKEKTQPRRVERDGSINGSGSEDIGPTRKQDDEEEGAGVSSESDYADDTGPERRLRLAEQYLDSIEEEIDEVGFDAADIDRDLIADRLKEDVAKTEGRLYRHIASNFAFDIAKKTQFRADTLSTTSIATCPPYVYTVSKDLTLIKWKLPTPLPQPSPNKHKAQSEGAPPFRCRPKQLIYTKGNEHKSKDTTYQHHVARILAVAASSDGRFVATGGADKRLIIWSAAELRSLRVFTQHRDAVTSLAFRHGTNQLYSSSKDRTIKSWSLNELAYIETLFGHQDEVVDVAALAQERCLSVGARDRTARLWKVVEETQLVFRGGGGGERKSHPKQLKDGNFTQTYTEGSIDRVAMIDDGTFVTGSDNGSLSLWAVHKKKPVFTLSLAHGLDPALRPDEAYAEENPGLKVPSSPQPRWITALATVPYSDLIISGSWDGWVRIWKVTEDKRRIEAVAIVGKVQDPDMKGSPVAKVEDTIQVLNYNGTEKENGDEQLIKGVINDISVFERGDRGKTGLCIVAAVGNEHRMGRWKKVKGKNGVVVFEVSAAKISEEVLAAKKDTECRR